MEMKSRTMGEKCEDTEIAVKDMRVDISTPVIGYHATPICQGPNLGLSPRHCGPSVFGSTTMPTSAQTSPPVITGRIRCAQCSLSPHFAGVQSATLSYLLGSGVDQTA